jgi:phosphoribosylglycinamide formyltransferase-1
MLKLGFLASGRGSNFQAIIDAVESGSIKALPELLIVDNPGAYAVERAKKHGVPHLFIDPGEFKTKEDFYRAITEELKRRGVALVILAGFMRVVKNPLLQAYPMRIINIHPALLPAFPGLHGQRQAVDYGVRVSGCTVHFVDEGVDTGPIIIQAAVPVMPEDTEDSLSERILKWEHRIFPEAVRLISEGRVEVLGGKVMVRDMGRAEPKAALLNPALR